MDISKIWERIARPKGGKIVYLIIDGVGGLPKEGKTELQAAHTPNLDRLTCDSSCGLLEIVGPGITPGSGPGHLALFGYDPIKYRVGRGILAALGIDFPIKKGDVAARINFCTIKNDRIIDRRAGRINDDTNRRLCEKIKSSVNLDFDGEFFLETVKQYRALLVLRGKNLSGDIDDTDPQQTGVSPLSVKPTSNEARNTASLVRSFIDQVRDILADEKSNMILLRGFDEYRPFPSLYERFYLKGVCIAEYPMYRGIGRLIGMEVLSPPTSIKESFELLEDRYGEFDFYFLHIKEADSYGEDGDFDGKVKIIEEVDRYLPKITTLKPDVLVVTGDHSTPSIMGQHSWHPVPILLKSKFTRRDKVDNFDEYSCIHGSLGLRPGMHLMGLALANAGRLKKYGA